MGRISMNDLITFLINYGFDRGISSTLTEKLAPDFPSCAYGHKVLINMNWHNEWEIPFSFAHELGHLINHDPGINYYHSPTVHMKSEFEANKTAIDILINYCQKNDLQFYNSIKFCDVLGVPTELEYIVELKLRKLM